MNKNLLKYFSYFSYLVVLGFKLVIFISTTILSLFLYKYLGDQVLCMDNSLDDNQIGSTNNSNLANSSYPQGQGVIVDFEIPFSQGVQYNYGVTQPDSSKGNLSNSERGALLAEYLDNAVKYKKEIIDNGQFNFRKLTVTHAGVNPENKSFIINEILNNPGTPAHNKLIGRSGNGRFISQVDVTKSLIEMIRNAR